MWGVRHRGGRLQQVTGQLHLTNTQKVCPPRWVPLFYSKPASPACPCLYPEHEPHPSSHYLDLPLNPEPLFSGAQPAHKVNMMSLPHQTNTSPTMTEGSLQAGAPLSVENCVCPTAAMALLALTPTQFCCFLLVVSQELLATVPPAGATALSPCLHCPVPLRWLGSPAGCRSFLPPLVRLPLCGGVPRRGDHFLSPSGCAVGSGLRRHEPPSRGTPRCPSFQGLLVSRAYSIARCLLSSQTWNNRCKNVL